MTDPVRHNFFCNNAAVDKIFSSSEHCVAVLFVTPSPQAANAHAKVRPYKGSPLDTVTPTPNAVAITADECPIATTVRGDTDLSDPTDPFKFTSVAAEVHPKCAIRGYRRYD